CWSSSPSPTSKFFVLMLKTVDKIIGFVLVFLIPTTVIVVLYMRLHTPTNFLLLSLAVSDFFVGLNMSFQIMLIDGCWLLSDHMCTLYFVLDYVGTCTSIGIMVLISIDRYVAICYPLHYSTKVTPKRVQVCVSLCWICSVLYTSIVMKDDLKQPGRYKSCVGECVMSIDIIHQIIDFIVLFLIPITIILALSITAKKTEMKAAGTLGVVIVVFIICLSPYFCVTITGQDTVVNASSASVVLCLYDSNSCFNPLVYAFFYPWFRKSIRLIATLKILKPGSCETKVL
uniref:G-protein coupled receptors family 1 profile domain-containing protein n=1 Tax=Anabas testudineus TaxID=64144 RepID=A0A3Q1JEY8_ANATE